MQNISSQQHPCTSVYSSMLPARNAEDPQLKEIIDLLSRITDKGQRDYAYTFIRLILERLVPNC